MALFFGGVGGSGGGGATSAPRCHHHANVQYMTNTQMTNFHEKREFFNFLKLHQMSSQ